MREVTKALLLAKLIENDAYYMHWLCKGEDFDKSHNLMEEYYYSLSYDSDFLAELAVELGENLPNPSNATAIIPTYTPEIADGYLYGEIIAIMKEKLEMYIDSLQAIRNSTTAPDVQSKIDDMLRKWKKEVDYRLTARTTPNIPNGFIYTGLDNALAYKFSGR